MGGGVATQMAARHSVAFLVLHAPLMDLWDIAQTRVPFLPGWLPGVDRWQSLETACDVSVPAFVVHGDADEVVPMAQGAAAAACLEVPLQVIPDGRHNTLFALGIFPMIQDFLDRL